MKYFQRILLLLCLLFTIQSTLLEAQVRLRFDRAHKVNSVYFDTGDVLTFRLKGSKEEYTLPITQILPESDVLVFPKLGTIKIEDLYSVRIAKDRRWAKLATASLYSFGLSWILFSLVDMAYSGDATWASTFGVAGTAGLLGWLISLLFRPKKYKLGKRNFLRIVNMGNFFNAP